MWLLALWPRLVGVEKCNRHGNNPSTYGARLRLKNADEPLTFFSVVERKPLAIFPANGSAARFDAHTSQPLACFNGKVIGAPALRHFHRRFSRERKATQCVVLTCIAEHFARYLCSECSHVFFSGPTRIRQRQSYSIQSPKTMTLILCPALPNRSV